MILYIKFLCLSSSLRTTLCVRFKSEVVACGVVYAAARRFQVPLPENPPWWKAFDADKDGIDEVCRVLAHLYSLPKAEYIPVCKDGDSFTFSTKSLDLQSKPASKVIVLFFSLHLLLRPQKVGLRARMICCLYLRTELLCCHYRLRLPFSGLLI